MAIINNIAVQRALHNVINAIVGFVAADFASNDGYLTCQAYLVYIKKGNCGFHSAGKNISDIES